MNRKTGERETTAEWFQRRLRESRNSPDYILEGVILDVTEQIVAAMQQQEVSRSEVAERMGVSRAYITKLLRGEGNTTLRTLVRVALALGLRPQVSFVEPEPMDDEARPARESASRAEVAAHTAGS